MYSLWPESFPRWINHDKVCSPLTSFLFISHPAHTPSMPLRSCSKDERDAHHHRKCCEIVVSMEMGSNTKAIIIWEASTHRWYLTFINEYNVTCELIIATFAELWLMSFCISRPASLPLACKLLSSASSLRALVLCTGSPLGETKRKIVLLPVCPADFRSEPP